MRLLAATLWSLLLYSHPALASELTLSWRAPEGCPTLANLQAGLESRLHRPVQLGPGAPIQVEAAVARDRAGFQLDLRTHTEAGDSRRELYTQSCNELARATLLHASLLLSTLAAPAAAEAAPAPRVLATHMHLTAAAVVDAGRLPVLAAGAAARLGIDVDAFRLQAGALYLAPRSTALEPASGANASLQLTAATLAACYALTRAPRLLPCAFAELGSLRAAGRGLAQDERTQSLWLDAGLAAQLSFGVTSWLDFETELSAGIPLRRPQLATRDLGVVYRVPALFGQLQAGLTAYFW
jgi:hypothetical protein